MRLARTSFAIVYSPPRHSAASLASTSRRTAASRSDCSLRHLARPSGINGEDTGFAFRPDSKAIASFDGQTVRLWDLTTGERSGSSTLSKPLPTRPFHPMASAWFCAATVH